jgi:hypothetical protein
MLAGMTGRASGLLVVAGLALTGLAWLAWTRHGINVTSATAEPAMASTQAAGSAAESAPSPMLAKSAGDPGGEQAPTIIAPAQAVPPQVGERPSQSELEARALVGDVAAASLLGRMFLRCSHRSTGGVDEIAEDWAKLESIGMETPKIGGEAVPVAMMIAATVEIEQADAALCEGVVIDRRHWREPALRWLEQAVDGGDIDAMIDYPRALELAAPRAEDILADAETWRQRRDRAARGLTTALAAGRADALWAHYEAHEDGFPLPRDPLRALAFVIAWREVGSIGPNVDRMRGMKEDELRLALAADEVARAEILARELVACCGGRQ